MKSVLCAVAVLVAVPAFADEPDANIKALATKGVKFDFAKGGNEPKAVEIKSADELAKAAMFADDAGRDAIKKQVDFSKQKLVVFVWSGSGGDKLSGALSKNGKSVVFNYTQGLTDDLRRHAHVFAVPKDAEVKMAKWVETRLRVEGPPQPVNNKQ
jgi:hypothetical protein